MRIRRAHFKVNPREAHELFASSVKTIEIEVSSYCNRVCSYCPNSLVDRRSNKYRMSDALYNSIISQLSGIGWSGSLRFHRYNEPLENREYIISRIRQAHDAIPKASIAIFTNGDYLDRDYLHELYVAGCRTIMATAHIGDGEYDNARAYEILESRIKKLGYPYTIKYGDNSINASVSVARDMILYYNILNFEGSVDGVPVKHDRAQALAPTTSVQRVAACYIPFSEMQIEMDGTLVPCCQIRTDIPSHKAYALGKLEPGSDIFMAWTNAEYVKWRRSLIDFGPKDAPCSTCHYGAKIHFRDRVAKIIHSPITSIIRIMRGQSLLA